MATQTVPLANNTSTVLSLSTSTPLYGTNPYAQNTPWPNNGHFSFPSSFGLPLSSAQLQKGKHWSLTLPFLLIVLYNIIMPAFEIMTVSFIAYYTNLPFIFPSLGPEAFLHFAVPDKLSASPRNSICGHFLGCLFGYIGLLMTGLTESRSVFAEGEEVTLDRIICLSFAIGMTCGAMVMLNVSHPPAGATTLIVALGIMHKLSNLFVLMCSVIILCVETWIITKIFRNDVKYPFWSHEHCDLCNGGKDRLPLGPPGLGAAKSQISLLQGQLGSKIFSSRVSFGNLAEIKN